MSMYEKPVISVDTGMAEGVYAASGSDLNSGKVSVKSSGVAADWGNSGQANFSIDLSGLNNRSQLTVVLTFNMEITSGWGGGASAAASGKQVTLTWYSAPESAEITVQANGNINQIECTGSSYSNN